MELKALALTVSALLVGQSVYASEVFSHPGMPVQQKLQPNLLQQSTRLQPEQHIHGLERTDRQYRPTDATQQPEPPTLLKRQVSVQQDAVEQCDLSQFQTTSSNQLMAAIRQQGASCVNALFSADTGVQEAAFSSNHMYNVAQYTRTLAQQYAGGGSDELEALYLYLRAGYYAEFYNSNITFLSWVTPAVKGAVDAFVQNAHFYDNGDAHGKVLNEVIITMDSAGLQHAYLDVVTQWLTRWNAQYAEHWYMRNAVNGVFTILFGGQWNNQYTSLIGEQTALVTALQAFALDRTKVNSPTEFMAANAARELGRLARYTDATIAPKVTEGLTAIFGQYPSYGDGDAIWLGAADTASYYADCSQFNICGFEDALRDAALNQTFICSDTIKIRSQDMSQAQHLAACDKMAYEESFFHTTLETGNQPVADDHNTQLQVNIFNSDTDYGKYAGPIFGIDTNNGGMYLEGNPANVGNIPNFIAYEASYANPDHFVWNLEHEYVHYLDGRFNMYGDFGTPTELVVWWSEGVAEYVSRVNDNPQAIATIQDGSTYTLAQVFDTTYDGFDVDRIYRWGYLAVRFMFERHPDEVQRMLSATRQGRWAEYKAIISGWANQYQSEFAQWTEALAKGDSGAGNGEGTGSGNEGGGESGGNTGLPENCAVLPKISDGRLALDEAACLADTASASDVLWFSIPAVSEYQTIAITAGNGTGDLTLEYSNLNWPDGTNVQASSANMGNSECIILEHQANYWGYLKVSGSFENAALRVEAGSNQCRQ